MPSFSHRRVIGATASASRLGSQTAGSWSVLIRGADMGLTGRAERVDGLASAPGTLFLSTAGPFSVAGVSGTFSDVLALAAPRTPAPPSIFLQGSALMAESANVDALDLPP